MATRFSEKPLIQSTFRWNLCLLLLFYHTSCVLIISAPAVAQTTYLKPYSQRRYFAEEINCQNVSEIYFLSFFPCLRPDPEFSASEKMSECDLLAEAAVYLAVDRVNEDPTILPNVKLKIHPVYIPNDKDLFTLHNQHEIIIQIFQMLYNANVSRHIWGFIGPDDNLGVANFIAPIASNAGLLTLSYGSRTKSDITDSIQTFYRTLTSDISLDIGLLVLLGNHNWFRIAVLTTTEEAHYSISSSHFISAFNTYIEEKHFYNINLDLTEYFTLSPDSALLNIKARDINIIVGFFGPENARKVLCKANSTGLVSSEYAWLLPSYYDPNWWKISNNSHDDASICSDQDMGDILESVIFFDNVKFPPTGLHLDAFHLMLMNKALNLFPSLTEESLKPYLLQSRATSAYDAVTLLARSVGVAFDQSGDGCTDTTLIKTALDHIFLRCEYCRLYSGFSACFEIKNMMFSNTLKGCNNCSQQTEMSNIIPTSYSSPIYDLPDRYGQILFSQFRNGREYPIVLWWPVFDDNDYNKSYLSIGSFDDDHNCVAKGLNLSKGNFYSGNISCSNSFEWRGSCDPPNSHFLKVSYISIEGLISIGVTTFIGLAIAAGLLIFNIIYRKNKNIKASSPLLNIVLLIGIIIRLPIPLYFGLVLSGQHYSVLEGKNLTAMCYFSFWQYYVGDTLFVASLIAKNWRIYKIFFNKKLEEKEMNLSDGRLLLGVALIMLPIIIILTTWSIFGLYYNKILKTNENLQITVISVCGTDEQTYLIFVFIANIFTLLLFIFLFVLSLLNASVPSSIFRREGLSSYKAAFIVILPTPLIFIARFTLVLSDRGFMYRALLWAEFTWNSVLPIFILMVLFSPIIHAVVREYFNKKYTDSKERQYRKLTEQYNVLKHKKNTLRSQIEEMDRTIKRIKTNLSINNSMGNDDLETSRTLGTNSERCGNSEENKVGSYVIQNVAAENEDKHRTCNVTMEHGNERVLDPCAESTELAQCHDHTI